MNARHRHPNDTCFNCGQPCYSRDLSNPQKSYCSSACRLTVIGIPLKECLVCNKTYKPSTRQSKYCSIKCSSTQSRKPRTLGNSRNTSNNKLVVLKRTFEFSTCMIEGCDYSKCFDIHRFVEGKNGGEYVVGNMFAVCPNHHAELHRKLIKVDKVNDFTLKII